VGWDQIPADQKVVIGRWLYQVELQELRLELKSTSSEPDKDNHTEADDNHTMVPNSR